jgi:RNA polymerase sigma factor (sigma-70 family)
LKIADRYSDEEVVAALQRGGREAERCLKHLYNSQLKFAIAYIKQNSGSVKDAEDIFQDSVIALYEQVLNKSYRGESGVNTYLMKILRNKWLNVIKRKGIHEKAVVQVDEHETRSIEREKAIKQAAKTLISQAGKDCQKILSLVFFYKYSMEEVAQFADFKNAQNARNKKMKCLKKIKAWIQQDPVLAKTFQAYVR